MIEESRTVAITSRHAGRLNYLDSLRALAAIGVVYLHIALGLRNGATGVEARLLDFFTITLDPGKIGVIVFFFISGFVIPISFKTDRSRSMALRDFVLGRIFRLYPAYWLSMVFAFFLLFGGSLAQCGLKRIFWNATMFQGFVGGTNINMLGVYWTLQIEWMFYLLCIVLFAAGWLSRPLRVFWTYLFFLVVSLAGAVFRFHTHRAVPIAAFLGLCVMLSSTLWRMVMLDGNEQARRPAWMALGSFILAVPVVSLLAYNFNVGHDENWYRYTFCYWTAIAIFLFMTSKMHLTWKPLVVVGRASFSLYLFNDIFQWVFSRIVPPGRVAAFSPHLYIAMAILFACLLSLPFYHLVERPAMALGKRLAHRLDLHERQPVNAS